MTRARGLGAAIFAALLSCWAGTAAAQAEAPPQLNYEQRHVRKALLGTGLLPQFLPQGKKIAFIKVVRYEVFADDEPFPTFPNAVHVVSKEFVVLREVLLAPGDLYDQALLVESARNLRSLGTFSLVAIVPVRAEADDEVGLLVVTRDLWSLRLETKWQLTGSTLNSFLVQLTERNLFGRHKTAAVNAEVVPLRWSIGQFYSDRRLLGNKLAVFEKGSLFFNRDTNDYEGLEGRLDLSRPFYDLGQRWGFLVRAELTDRIARRLQGDEVALWDDPETDDVETVRQTWDHRAFAATILARHQFPGPFTHRVSFGFGFTQLDATPIAATLLPEANRDSFERRVLPRNRTQAYPTASWTFFETRFRTFKDIALYGLSEDMQLGPAIGLSARAPLEALGSSDNAVAFAGFGVWTEDYAGTGFWSLGVGGEGQLQHDGWLDERILVRARGALPYFAWGRGVLRAEWLVRRKDSSNELVSLGGDNGLRGYPTQHFAALGADRVRANVEWRAPPFVWSFLHMGLAAFYDAGSVYTNADDFALKQSVGVGARLLLPQINRLVTRFDLGFPVDGSGFMVQFSAGSAQAVPVTPLEDLQFEDTSIGGLSYEP